MSHITNVALVGASGISGKYMAEALLKTGKHTITAISRHDSKATFMDRIKVVRVDYDDHSSLVRALQGQDALVMTLAGTAPHDQSAKLIRAAAEANVPWILPNEWSPDSANDALYEDITFVWEPKRAARKLIEELGKSSWIAVVSGFWYEWSLAIPGAYGFDIVDRSVTLLDGGDTPITTTTWPQLGRAVANLLSLPVKSGQASAPDLEQFRNKHAYVSSFTVSQNEMFESLLRVTGDRREDWTILHDTAESRWTKGREMTKNGDRNGFFGWLYGRVMAVDGAGNHEKNRNLSNDLLGLSKEEDMDAYTKIAVDRARSGRIFTH